MLEIRRANPTDAAPISALITSLAHLFFASPDGHGAERFRASMTPQGVALFLARPVVNYWVAEADGAFCGAAGMRDHRHLHHLFVVPAFHRNGIGRQLWLAARDAALAAGNPGEFTVNASLNAVPVYQRLGFESQGSPQRANGLVFQPMKMVVAQGAASATGPPP
jgi:GNAT superfamily N-acetyltransferase